MYRIFYNHKTMGDTLVIVFEPELYPDETRTNGNVTYLYKGGKIVGINIANIGEIVKIKAEGMIATPSKELIDAINVILEGKGEKLPYCLDSGYAVLQIEKIEEHPLDEKCSILTLTDGSHGTFTVTRYQNIKVGDLIVVAKDGCIKYDGSRFQKKVVRNIPVEAEVCSAKDLRLGDEDKKAFIPTQSKPGEDFFLGGR